MAFLIRFSVRTALESLQQRSSSPGTICCLLNQKRLPISAAVEAKELYIQRGTWRVSDRRSHFYAPIKAHRVPGHIVCGNDPSSAARPNRVRRMARQILCLIRRPPVRHHLRTTVCVTTSAALGVEMAWGESGLHQPRGCLWRRSAQTRPPGSASPFLVHAARE